MVEEMFAIMSILYRQFSRADDTMYLYCTFNEMMSNRLVIARNTYWGRILMDSYLKAKYTMIRYFHFLSFYLLANFYRRNVRSHY